MQYAQRSAITKNHNRLFDMLERTSDLADDTEVGFILVLRHKATGSSLPTVEDLSGPDRKIYSIEEYADKFGGDGNDLPAIKAFADHFDLAIVSTDLENRHVVLKGRASSINEAFNIRLGYYGYMDGQIRGFSGTPAIPAELQDIVVSVIGLNSPPLKRHKKTPPPQGRILPTQDRILPTQVSNPPVQDGNLQAHEGNPPTQDITPYNTGFTQGFSGNQYAQLYHFPQGGDGSGQRIGIIELGGGYSDEQMKTYFQQVKVSPMPSITAVNVGTGQNQPGTDPQNDSELALDIQVAAAAARGAGYVLYFAANSTAGFIQAINAAISDKTNRLQIISISWGLTESSWSQAEIENFEEALRQAAATNITVIAAAGDHGSTDGVTDGQQHVQYPSSSQLVTSCGGTSITITNSQISGEVVWNSLSNGASSTGGGFSSLFDIPGYQKNVVPASLNANGRRGVPDIAASADFWAYGFYIYYDGKYTVTGGTSGVAPLIAALQAIINQQIGQCGFVNPFLYQAASGKCYNPITQGNNGDYQAGTPWNPCTGLGSPNGGLLLSALKQLR
jgi:kumamolisin